MSIKDLVDVALGRYHEALEADEAFDAVLQSKCAVVLQSRNLRLERLTC